MRGRGRGFSLVELLVVGVLLTILAAAVIPRFTKTAARRAQAQVDAIADVVSTAGARDQLTSQAVALDMSGGRLAVLSPAPGSDRGAAPGWREDPLAGSVVLEDVAIRSVRLDAADLDPESWRVEFSRHEARGRLTLIVGALGDEREWAIVLSPTATRAMVVDPAQAELESDTFDLDGATSREGPW